MRRWLVLACLAFTAIAAEAHAAEETLELAVTINGHSSDKIAEFVEDGTTLKARPSELSALGLRTPPAIAPGPDGMVSLSDIPGLTTRVDWPNQTLYIAAGDSLLMPNILEPWSARSNDYHVESGTGAALNYDIVGDYASGAATASGFFDARAFSRWGVATTTMLAYAGATPANGSDAVRLDSSYSYADVQAMRRYIVGDYTNGALSWTRAVRLGGFKIESDFSMRPDLVTFPLPSVIGQTAVPSTVDVLVNSTRVLSQQTAPGPFEVPQLPVVNGANTITTTLTNALGQQVVATLPFYASSDLLAPGLQSYSLEAGFVRKNWGLLSNDYGNLAASATYRQGLTPDLTAELHAESTGGAFMTGGGVVANLFDFGVANVSLSGSTASGRTGGQVALGVQRTGQTFSFGVSAILSGRTFRDIAAMNGEPLPRRQINANFAVSLERWGSFGLAYTQTDTVEPPVDESAGGLGGETAVRLPGAQAPPADASLLLQPARHARLITASYSLQVGRVSIFATGLHDFSRGGNSGVMVGLTLPLGTRSSVSADMGTGTDGSHAEVQAQQSAVSPGDWGYQVFADSGGDGHEFATAQYKAAWGQVSAGVDNVGHRTTLRGEAQGALATADDVVFAANTINDSFAVVDTEGTPDVHVFYANRPVGTTDSEGKILVPDLRSFDVNHLSIDPADVPPSDSLSATSQDVRPQDRSGIVVRFAIHPSHGAIVHIVAANGQALPVGSVATLMQSGTATPVGYEGETYIQGLQEGSNRVEVTAPDGRRCMARFEYRPDPGNIPSIGPVACQVNDS